MTDRNLSQPVKVHEHVCAEQLFLTFGRSPEAWAFKDWWRAEGKDLFNRYWFVDQEVYLDDEENE